MSSVLSTTTDDGFPGAPAGHHVDLFTTMGRVQLELYWNHAPNTCRNFFELVRRGRYSGTRFHRVVRNYVIQAGAEVDVVGGGAHDFEGRNFEGESVPELRFTGAGIVAVANVGEDATSMWAALA